MRMITVKITTNTERTSVVVASNTTIREVLADNDVDYSTGTVSIDGASLAPGDMDKSFEDFGITGDSCYLSVTIKTGNGRA
jgi:hypothetical protein